MSDKKSGTVKFYNAEKSFGFITPDDGSKDVFVHRSALTPGAILRDGDKVQFSTEDTPKGISATAVEVVE